MIICQVCKREFKSKVALSQHIKVHNITTQDYYTAYLKTPEDGFCKICHKPTRNLGLNGYALTCSCKCAAIYSTKNRKQTCLSKYGVENVAQDEKIKNKIRNTVKSEECQNRIKTTNLQRYNADSPMKNPEVKLKAKENVNYTNCGVLSHITRNKLSDEYEVKNNCTRISKLIDKYGQGWLSIKNSLNVTNFRGYTYIDNAQVSIIENYCAQLNLSKPEIELYDFVKALNIDAIQRDRLIIKPYELDIYIPSKNITIEYNGTYWHCIENGTPKEYHLNKSLICREKGIRLIHIYEFEDFETQKYLLKNLLSGNDLFPKDDFNKNNLIETIPAPKMIYKSKRNETIYGAGELKEVIFLK